MGLAEWEEFDQMKRFIKVFLIKWTLWVKVGDVAVRKVPYSSGIWNCSVLLRLGHLEGGEKREQYKVWRRVTILHTRNYYSEGIPKRLHCGVVSEFNFYQFCSVNFPFLVTKHRRQGSEQPKEGLSHFMNGRGILECLRIPNIKTKMHSSITFPSFLCLWKLSFRVPKRQWHAS